MPLPHVLRSLPSPSGCRGLDMEPPEPSKDRADPRIYREAVLVAQRVDTREERLPYRAIGARYVRPTIRRLGASVRSRWPDGDQ
jgi:hypothetical protein